jgi:hypothetical protein
MSIFLGKQFIPTSVVSYEKEEEEEDPLSYITDEGRINTFEFLHEPSTRQKI